MEPVEVEFLAEKQLITIVPNFSENKLCLISGEFGPFNPSMHTQVPLWLALNLRQRHKCRIEPPQWLNVDTLTEKKREEQESPVFTKMPSPHYMEVAMLVLNKLIFLAATISKGVVEHLKENNLHETLSFDAYFYMWTKVLPLLTKAQRVMEAILLKMLDSSFGYCCSQKTAASLICGSAGEDVPRSDEVRALVKDIWDLRVAKLRKSVNIMVLQQETYAKLDNLTVMEINTIRSFLTNTLDRLHSMRVPAQMFRAGDDSSTL